MILLSTDLRRVLVAAAISLLGIFATTILAQALPLQLLQPSWIARLCSAILGGVSFPLVAMVLLLLAAEGRPRDKERPAKAWELSAVVKLRRLCWFVTLGFVLMIPLQTWAGVKLLRQTIQNDRQQLAPYRRSLDLIRIAETPEAMIAAISSLPGAPPDLIGELRDPLPKVRQQLIDEIEPQIKARQTQLQALNGQRWQQSILRWVKDGIVAAFSAFGFAAIGRLSPERDTWLARLLPREGDYWKTAFARHREKQWNKAWRRLWPWSKRNRGSRKRNPASRMG